MLAVLVFVCGLSFIVSLYVYALHSAFSGDPEKEKIKDIIEDFGDL